MGRLRNALLAQQQSKQKKPSGVFGQNNSTVSDAIKGYRQGARIARAGNVGAVDQPFANAFPELANYEATSMLGAADSGVGLDAALTEGSNLGSLGSVGTQAGSDFSYYMPDLASQTANLGTSAASGTEAATGVADAGTASSGITSALGASGIAAIGMWGTNYGNQYFAKHGNAQERNGWATLNSANNGNAILQAPGMIDSALHGQKFTTQQQLGTAISSGGLSTAYNPALAVTKGKKVDQKDIAMASLASGPLAPLTFTAMELYNLAAGIFGGHKGKDQVARDDYREGLKKAGALDKDYNLTLADGSKYDFGADGKNRLTSTDGSKRRTYDPDFKNPLTAQAIAWANPLANVLTDGDKKKATYLTGQLANAAISNAQNPDDVKNNIKGIFGQLKIDSNIANTKLGELANKGTLKDDEARIYQAGVNDLGLPSYQQQAPVEQQVPEQTNTGYQPLSEQQQQALQDQIMENAKRFE